MAVTRRLDEFFRVAERFRRSVNVALDYADDGSLNGYVITPLSAAVLTRIAAGLGPDSKNRSWSITGPYGAGKSACMLFLGQLLGYPPRETARAVVREEQPELYRRALAIPGLEQGGFVVVPMVCSRQPLAVTLLSGFLDSFGSTQESSPDLAQHVAEVKRLSERARQGDSVPSVEVARVVERAAELLQAQDPSVLGLIIVLDELGKALEYAALNPERGDIELLQILSEMASRSERPVIGLLTVLHQAFEHYAAGLSPVQQREWNKVQGRFEDVGFFQSPGELLGLVSKAIELQSDETGLRRMLAAEVSQAGELELLPRDLSREQALRILVGCAPLHPTSALALGPLFRSRLAQNERSLFAFLCSGEPHGFQDFVHSETWRDNGYRPFYRLDQLHDYVRAALGSGLYAQAQGKHWAEISEALDRLPSDAAELDARLVKAIGMLDLLGDQRYLRASSRILTYALADGHITAQHVEESLKRLETWKIAIYQRFKDAYGLWQGSDVDLDARFEQGAGQIDRSVSLAERLQKGGYLKPYVAKRHLYQTGTLRFLLPIVADLQSLERLAPESLDDADGIVAFVLPPPGMRLQEVTSQVLALSAELRSPSGEQVLFAIPRHTHGVREALEEVATWDWVTRTTPELEGDSVARRELSARRLAARTRLERAISRGFDLSSGHTACIWVWQGQERAFASARALASFVSDVCDQVYAQAPIIRNELINRRSPSSAAAAARRALIERMLANGREENLGMQGYPPEMSIYLSVLRNSGLHQVSATGVTGVDSWAFGPPSNADDSCHVRPLWQAIDEFMTTTESGRRPVTDLYDLLGRPPFGVREGVLPIYLAAYMLHSQAEVALYEEGTFVPQVRIAEFERLLRAPQRFALQRYRLTDARSRMLDGYVRLFNPKPEPCQVTMLNAVRGLMGFAAQLPRYAQLTERLSDDARAIRRVLASAREPQPLLFEVLPAALAFTVDDPRSDTDAYFSRLRKALLELHQAYDRLLTAIEHELRDALRLPAQLSTARQEIAQRSGILGDWISDLNLRAFVSRLGDSRLAERDWLESVAALVASKPPASWSDADWHKYCVALAQYAEQLRRVEEIALSKGEQNGVGRLLRIGVMDDAGQERRDVLRVMPEQEPEIEQAISALETALNASGLDERLRLTALAELARRLLGGRSTGKDEHEG